MDNDRQFSLGSWLRSAGGLALLAFLAIAGFFLVTEHTAHFFGALPFLLVLLCPLLHLVMHSRHGGHGGTNLHGAQANHTGHPPHHLNPPKGGQK